MKSSKVLKICIVATLILSAVIIINGQLKIRAIKEERSILLGEEVDLLEQLGELKLELDNVQSDEFIENAAREKLGLIKPGEELIVIAEPADGDGIVEQKINKDIEIGD